MSPTMWRAIRGGMSLWKTGLIEAFDQLPFRGG